MSKKAKPEDRLADFRKQATAVEEDRVRAEQQVVRCNAQLDDLARRVSAIQVATTALNSLTPVEPEQEWLDNLNAWRKTLCEELLAMPERLYAPRDAGRQQNLKLSILTLDHGPSVLTGTGYELTNLRLGELMRAVGYEETGADPERNRCGQLPWFGSIPQTEERISALVSARAKAQALLDEALMDDADQARLAAEQNAARAALNALPQRKIRGDGSQYDLHLDGRIVEVSG